MSRIARVVSVAIFPLLGLLMIRTAESQTSLKSAPGPEQSQKPAEDPYVPTLTYDVASVREVDIAGGPGAPINHGLDARLDRSSIRLTNSSILSLLFFAYGVRFQQISGL